LWSSTEYDSTNARRRYLTQNYVTVYRGNHNKSALGFSIRCIKD
jgi:uncharacterized protein (TIGR02145 family)